MSKKCYKLRQACNIIKVAHKRWHPSSNNANNAVMNAGKRIQIKKYFVSQADQTQKDERLRNKVIRTQCQESVCNNYGITILAKMPQKKGRTEIIHTI